MKFFAALLLFFSSMSLAAPAPKSEVSKVKIDALVKEFYLNKNALKNSSQKPQAAQFFSLGAKSTGFRPRPGDNCERPGKGGDCLDAACSRLDSYECDDQSEIDRVLNICRGVDGDCITSACNRLDSYECDDVSEIESVAKACKRVFDGHCVDVVCNRLDSYECDDISEIESVAGICSGRVDADCIESVCSRLDSYKCDDVSEIEQVAKSCGGK